MGCGPCSSPAPAPTSRPWRATACSALTAGVARFAVARADALAEDHARVRATGVGVSRITVKPVLPPDVIGLFVLVPAEV